MNRKLTKQHTRPGLRLRPIAQNLMFALGVGLYASNGFALPQGAQVAAGTANIVQQGNVLTVTNSANAILNWQAFNIGVGETTRFIQPSAVSAVLNRVVGGDPSAILGMLSSNGRVFLINPTGIIFGAGAKIDTAGFVASTLNITDQNFLQGKLQFEGQGGRILNEGDIKAIGNVYLVAPDIQNSGTIKSENGSVVLAAGQKVLLSDADPNQVVFEVQAPESSALNLGNIEASKSVGIFANSLTHSGAIKAVDMVAGEGGKVVLTGASVKLTSGSSIDVSAPKKGGTVLVGGDYQGKNPQVRNATTTLMERDATIKADATQNGDGGKVILWADDNTRAYGSISARGGAEGGNGGFIETSAHHLDVEDIRIDTQAPQGSTGMWLLDPTNIYIADNVTNAQSAGMVGGDQSAASTCPACQASGATNDSLVEVVTLQTALGSSNVTVTTSNISGAGLGDIKVVDPVSWASNNKLTLTAERNIEVNANINATGVSSSLEFIAGGTLSGAASINAATATFSANQGINLTGANNIPTVTLNNTGAGAAGNVFYNGSSATLNISGVNSAPSGSFKVVTTGSLNVFDNLSTNNGMVSLNAGGALTQTPGKVIGATSLRVSGASVNLPEANPVGVIAGAAVGNFTYHSTHQVTLSTVDGVAGITAGSGGNVTLSSDQGIDQQSGAVITASNLSTTAATGINLNLENHVSSFDAQASGGDIFLRNAGGLSIVNPVRATNGEVTIDTLSSLINVTGNLPVIEGYNGVNLYAGYLYMDDSGSTQTISSVNGPVSIVVNNFWLGGSRTINAPSVRITSLETGRPINIVSNAAYSGCQSGGTSLCLDAAQLDSSRITSAALTIGSNVSEPIPGSVNFGPSGAITITDTVNRSAFDLYLLSGGDISQTAPIQAATLGVASSGGNVNLVSSNSVSNIVGMVPDANSFNFVSSGPITVSSVTPFGGTTYSGIKAGGVSLNSMSGSISVNNPIVSSGYVSLEAYGDINGSALISGTDLFLTSTMMGNLGPLNTAVSTLDASASFGTISVSNTGNLTIQNQLETMGSSINVTTTGDLTVATETLVSVGSGSGGSTLELTSTGGKIDILPLATLSALGGSINLSASSDVNIGIGGTVEPNVATIDATGGTVTVTSANGIINRDPTAVILGTYNEVLPPPVIVPPSGTSSESETVQAPMTQIVALTENTTNNTVSGTGTSTTSGSEGGTTEMTEEEKRAAAEAAGQTSGTGASTTTSAGVPACQ
ncbi:MAG: filamentous hemagglutinin family outer membrane protein [Proteobacteria bacterium]|nr:filamentous hemagglutinin family outer membrane protein [Pseudomonadota bacterium]